MHAPPIAFSKLLECTSSNLLAEVSSTSAGGILKGIFLRNITVIFGKLKVKQFSRKHLAKLKIIIFK